VGDATAATTALRVLARHLGANRERTFSLPSTWPLAALKLDSAASEDSTA